jgi:hypothetical protein
MELSPAAHLLEVLLQSLFEYTKTEKGTVLIELPAYEK